MTCELYPNKAIKKKILTVGNFANHFPSTVPTELYLGNAYFIGQAVILKQKYVHKAKLIFKNNISGGG